MSQLEFNMTGREHWWQFHARELAHERRGPWNQRQRIKRVVYWIADVVKAFDEGTARAKFRLEYPQAKLVTVLNLGPVDKPEAPRKRQKKSPQTVPKA